MLDQQVIFREFLGPIDIVMAFVVLLFIGAIAMFQSQAQPLETRKLYNLNIAFKLLFSVIFATYYIMIFKGGDTYAYWQSTGVIKGIMLDDFNKFVDILNAENSWENFKGFFNTKTGYPMRFIFMEQESFFVCKLLVLFHTLTLGSYISTTLILAFWLATVNWKLFVEVRKTPHLNQKWLPVLFLFIPSMSFWATGVSKDTFALIFIFNVVYHIIRLYKNESKFRLLNVFWCLFYLFLLYKIRPFLLGAVLLPILVMYAIHLINKLDDIKFIKYIVQAVGSVLIVGIALFAFQRYINFEYLSGNSAFNSALVIQQDFETNTETYGEDEGKRYSLGIEDGSTASIVRSFPIATIAGIYRPFIWEALRPSLIFNGLESLVYLFLTIRFFGINLRKKISWIFSNQLLTFAVLFIFIIAFMTGFTSILFGVLVRLRAPLLPFLGLLFAVEFKKEEENKRSKSINTADAR